MVTGISSQTDETTQPARDINPILGNKDRTKYEMRKARAKDDRLFVKQGNFLGELGTIMEEYEGYIVL